MHNGSERKLASSNEVRLNESRSSWVILLPWFLSVLPIRPLRLRAFAPVCVCVVCGCTAAKLNPIQGLLNADTFCCWFPPPLKCTVPLLSIWRHLFFFFFSPQNVHIHFSPWLPLNLSGTSFTVTPVQVVTATTLRINLLPCVGFSFSVANHGFSYAAFNPWCVGQAQQEGDAFVAFEKCFFFIDRIERWMHEVYELERSVQGFG